jgi:hypothetical protein
MVKPRSGFETPLQRLFALVGNLLDPVKGFDAVAMQAKLAQYEAMAPSVLAKKLEYEMAADTLLQLSSDIWQVGMLVYAYAKLAARTDPKVAAAIAPFEAFMKKKGRKKKPPTTPSTPPTSNGA